MSLPPQNKPHMAQGKRLLLEAAARLAARQGCAQAVSLRELAREAGLNHNTFYRHFDSLEDLLGFMVDAFGQQLREGLKRARQEAPSVSDISAHVVGWLLDFAVAHQDVFVVAMRERYGPHGPLRQAVETMLEQLQDDMLAELQARQALPPLLPDVLRPVLAVIIDQTFQTCFEHIEHPHDKARRLAQAQALFETLMIGAMARVQKVRISGAP